MGRTHLVIPDQHAHPDYNNDRALWLGELIRDVKPDVVVNIGDAADLPSLSTHESSRAAVFSARNYEKDINSHLDFQEKLWAPTRRAKKKRPYRVVLEGNHEYRIKRVVNLKPELAGDRFGISFRNLDFHSYYDDIIEYEGQLPGVITIDDISYAHFFPSGIMGRPISGEHHAHSLIVKQLQSCVVGHTHLADWCVRTDVLGNKHMGLVCGVYQDYDSDWAGILNRLWWRGCVILRNVEHGHFDPQFISIGYLRKEYA